MSAPKFDPMEYIWGRLPKNPDGQTVTYLHGDLAYLYHNGFVDTLKFTYKQWETAFIPFKQQGGTYLLDKTSFFSLRLFRYHGPSHAAFDPSKLREGAWPDDELEFLYEKSVKPSSSITREIFWTAIGALKKSGAADESGQLVVNEKVRKQFNYILEKFPSPRRRLEKEVARLKKEKATATVSTGQARESSQFAVGKTQKEATLANLQKLQSSQATVPEEPQPGTSAKAIDLKSLRRPGGKLIG